jgi:tyrosyl-tRNA synthetase
MENLEHIVLELKNGTSGIIPEADFIKKLESGESLRIKLGMDPTAPDLHLGHAVVLSKLRQFQDLGHEVIFLIGDFTARIGDPTGKSKTRPPLTEEIIENNMKTYFDQVGRILDVTKLTVSYNSEWLGRLTSSHMVQLCAKLTLARLTEREDFANRIKNQQSVGLHELLYPVFQAYDSVELEADVELGGTDQTFNMLLGRFLQEQYGKKPQVIMTMPLLEGLDGVNKMSKSLGNTIGLTEPADQVYGKLMSISDTLMWRYFELLLGTPPQELEKLKAQVASKTLRAIDTKKLMAHGVVAKFWSQNEAKMAQDSFEALFQKKDYSQAQEIYLPGDTENPVWIVQLIKVLTGIDSSSEVKRLLEAGAISIDGCIFQNFGEKIAWKAGMIVKVGKHRIYKIG